MNKTIAEILSVRHPFFLSLAHKVESNNYKSKGLGTFTLSKSADLLLPVAKASVWNTSLMLMCVAPAVPLDTAVCPKARFRRGKKAQLGTLDIGRGACGYIAHKIKHTIQRTQHSCYTI
jgi:hypothetical protein